MKAACCLWEVELIYTLQCNLWLSECKLNKDLRKWIPQIEVTNYKQLRPNGIHFTQNSLQISSELYSHVFWKASLKSYPSDSSDFRPLLLRIIVASQIPTNLENWYFKITYETYPPRLANEHPPWIESMYFLLKMGDFPAMSMWVSKGGHIQHTTPHQRDFKAQQKKPQKPCQWPSTPAHEA